MPLTRVGPNRWADLNHPSYKHLQPYTGPALQRAAAPVTRAPIRPPLPAAPAPRPASAGKALPPVPEFYPVHPSGLQREQMVEEFDALFDWLKAAGAAPGTFTPAQREKAEDVGKRVDLLRMFIWA